MIGKFRFSQLLLVWLFVCSPALASDLASRAVTITDSRSPDQLKGRRDSNFSAISFLPDGAVSPLPIEQLRTALTRHPGADLQLTVSELRIIDFFPSRAKGKVDPIMRALVKAKTDWSTIDKLGVPPKSDSVICIFSGTINGQPFSTSAFSHYDLPPWAFLVRKNEHFKAAVVSSIEQIADTIDTQVDRAGP